MNKQTLYIALGTACLVAVAGGGWYLMRPPMSSPGMQAAAAIALPKVLNQHDAPKAPALLPPRTPPAGQSEYRSEFYRFQLFYPGELSVHEYDGPDSSRTITFESADKTEAFQIFIVPDGDAQIPQSRFTSDIPSGIIDSMQTTTIDGAPADVFFSNDASLGDTREVWILGHGFLYEVTTVKSLDSWLAQIMTSWQFLDAAPAQS